MSIVTDRRKMGFKVQLKHDQGGVWQTDKGKFVFL